VPLLKNGGESSIWPKGKMHEFDEIFLRIKNLNHVGFNRNITSGILHRGIFKSKNKQDEKINFLLTGNDFIPRHLCIPLDGS
jgi:hypothetical protein